MVILIFHKQVFYRISPNLFKWDYLGAAIIYVGDLSIWARSKYHRSRNQFQCCHPENEAVTSTVVLTVILSLSSNRLTSNQLRLLHTKHFSRLMEADGFRVSHWCLTQVHGKWNFSKPFYLPFDNSFTRRARIHLSKLRLVTWKLRSFEFRIQYMV